MTKVVVFFDIYALPCTILLTIFLIKLVVIARNQQRKIEAERINLRNLATNNPAANQVPQPKRARSLKPVKYLCIYSFFIVVVWVPNIITGNVTTFQKSPSAITSTLLLALGSIAMFQMLLGALFLTYAQREHREVLRNAFKAINNKLNLNSQR